MLRPTLGPAVTEDTYRRARGNIDNTNHSQASGAKLWELCGDSLRLRHVDAEAHNLCHYLPLGHNCATTGERRGLRATEELCS
jgi:hypothetical protein